MITVPYLVVELHDELLHLVADNQPPRQIVVGAVDVHRARGSDTLKYFFWIRYYSYKYFWCCEVTQIVYFVADIMMNNILKLATNIIS